MGWGLPGSLETEKAVDDGWIKVASVANRWKVRELAKKFKIQIANAETVQLALEQKPDFVLADEQEIRRLAEENGLRVRGCLGILIEGVRNGFVSVSEAEGLVEELGTSGYRVSREILKTFHALLKGLVKRR